MEQTKQTPDETIDHVVPKVRPNILFGSTRKIITGCGAMYVTINYDRDNKPFELFTQIGKAGGCAASQTESIGRLVSLLLRGGIEAKDISRQLVGITCHQPTWDKGIPILSCADAISKTLSGIYSDESKERKPNLESVSQTTDIQPDDTDEFIGSCPDCASPLTYSEGCQTCSSCGYSKC